VSKLRANMGMWWGGGNNMWMIPKLDLIFSPCALIHPCPPKAHAKCASPLKTLTSSQKRFNKIFMFMLEP